MYHDYTGKVLHNAHQRDLLEEAKGDRLLKAAPPDPAAEQIRWTPQLAAVVTWLLIAAVLVAGLVAVAGGALNVA